MNITLISSLIALILGGVIGAQLPIRHHEQTETRVRTETAWTQTDALLPEDFISMRPVIDALPEESLSEAENTDLLFMREEEKLARDVYLTLGDRWGMQIFSNIAQSEQTHTEAIRNLLVKYRITDPVTNDTVGVFANADLAELYTVLIKDGSQSMEAALRVGARIEDLDIADLTAAVTRTDNADIALVYENLLRGSRNHLRAFTSQLSSRGEVYAPEYIDAETYTAIIEGDTEIGNQVNRGWGSGQMRRNN